MRFYFCPYCSLSYHSVRTYLNNQCMLFHESLCINIRMEANNNGITFQVGAFLSKFKQFLWDCSVK